MGRPVTENDIINNDYVICKICKKKMHQIHHTHLKWHHITVIEYKNKFNLTSKEMMSKSCQKIRIEQLKRRKGSTHKISKKGLKILQQSIKTRIHDKGLVSISNKNRTGEKRSDECKAKIGENTSKSWKNGVFDYLDNAPHKGKSSFEETRFGNIFCRSTWEVAYLKKLEQDGSVISVSSEPCSIPYLYENKNRNYRPDFLVKTNKGNYLDEVKPEKFITNEQVQLKAKAAKLWCKENNMTYRFITEKDIF